MARNGRRIIGGVATIPSRQKTFRRMLESVAPHIDLLWVYLSGYVGYLNNMPPNVRQVKLLDDPYADGGKFIGYADAAKEDAYYLTFDDDLLYPPEYVGHTIAEIERRGRKAIVTYHGRNFDRLPTGSYYRGATRRFYCLRHVGRDVQVHVGGSGVMGVHTSTLALSMADFPLPFMADLHISVAARRQSVPIIVLKHAEGWITHLPITHSKSIYNVGKDDDQEQTRIINREFAGTYQ